MIFQFLCLTSVIDKILSA